MISVSRLLCGTTSPGDSLRYREHVPGQPARPSPGPVVVWNCTGRCNLRCIHCYASGLNCDGDGQMDT